MSKKKDEITQLSNELSDVKTEVNSSDNYIMKEEVIDSSIKTQILQLEAQVSQSETQPETQVSQPETQVSQPETQVSQTETQVSQSETQVSQSETQVSQSETQVSQSKIQVNDNIESKIPEISGYSSLPKITKQNLKIGDIIDEKYQIVSELGRGGLGIVFKVEHIKLPNRKQFALKILQNHLFDKKNFRKRFLREVMVAMEFTHEHAIQIRDFGEHWDGSQYFTMDYSQGFALSDLVKKEIFSEKRALVITRQILLALNFAHQKGIIHRDLKPQNVIIENREKEHALVLDFGLAKIINKKQNTEEMQLTGEAPIGTPYYMSPEQVKNIADIDQRTDIYSIGIILYQLLTKKVPFSGTYWEIILGHTDRVPISPKKINQKISKETEFLILKTLAKKREDRFQTAGDFIKKIDLILQPTSNKKSFTKIIMAFIFVALICASIFFMYHQEVAHNKKNVEIFYKNITKNKFEDAQKKLAEIYASWLNNVNTNKLEKYLSRNKQKHQKSQTKKERKLYLKMANKEIQNNNFLKTIWYLEKAENIGSKIAKEQLLYVIKFKQVEDLLQEKKWVSVIYLLKEIDLFYSEKISPPVKIAYIKKTLSLCQSKIAEQKQQIIKKKVFRKLNTYLKKREWLEFEKLLSRSNSLKKTTLEKEKWKTLIKKYPPASMNIYWKKSQNHPWQKAQDQLYSGCLYQIRLINKISKLYIYGFQGDSSGKIQQIFPGNEITSVSYKNPVQQGEFFIPAPGSAFRLDHTRGKEYFYLLFSNVKLEKPDECLQQHLRKKKKYSVRIIGPFNHR